jgi:ABC-type polysaccharide/polyol phosphate transport system ATPase subunit
MPSDVTHTPDTAVLARDLGKTYRVYANPWARVGEALLRRTWHRSFPAVEGVSFDLPRGEGLGVIGENGAGKSTLLKMLAGIVAPSHGRLEVRGKVASILELGSGFHPDFTGRQNIVLNAAMLGLSEAEVRAKTPAIIAFSELGHFIDQPVKTYSTGMGMRLGFSIATQVEPDVLIIDEALSVGDGYFQKKCMERLQRFLGEGGTLLFCSHAMYYVSAFCQRALWLRGGRVAAEGRTDEVVRDYEAFLVAKSRARSQHEEEPEAGTPGPVRITGLRLLGGRAVAGAGGRRRYRRGEPLALELSWHSDDPGLACHVGVGINRVDEVEVLSFATHLDGRPAIAGGSEHTLRLEVPELPLVKGQFTLYVFLLDDDGLHVYDRRIVPAAFDIDSPSYVFGLVDTEHRWARPEAVAARASVPAGSGERSAVGGGERPLASRAADP